MKKNNKLVKVLLASSLLLPGIAPLATGVTSVAAATETSAAKAVDAQYVTVVDQVLRNVRSDQASSNGFVPAGKTVTNVRDAGKGWFEVDFAGNTGYIQRSEVTSVENYEDMGTGDIHNVDTTVDSTRDSKYIVAVTTGLRTKDVDVYRPLRMLDEGEEVEYLGTTDNGWFFVKDENNVEGYVYAGDVTSVENYNDDSTPELHEVDTTNESSREGKHELLLTSSIRTKDNDAYRVISELQRGDVVTYLGTTANNWFKVQTEDKKIGFIYRGDVTQVEEEVVTDLAVESVSAINTKAVEVTFSEPVDTDKAKFSLKKGNSTVAIDQSSFNEEGTVATLSLNGKISEGTYTVSVTGLTDEALTSSFDAEDEKVDSIEFLSNELVLSNKITDVDEDTVGTAAYQVLNQYGEDITKDSIANGFDFSTSTGNIKTNKTGNGIVTIDNLKTPDYTPRLGDKVVVTIVDVESGKSASKTLEIADAAKVNEIKFGEVVSSKKSDLTEDTVDYGTYYLPFEAKDQYGFAIEDEDLIKGDLLTISSNPMVASVGQRNKMPQVVEIEVDGESTLAFVLEFGMNKMQMEGTATITAISKTTGKQGSADVVVAPGLKVDTIKLGNPAGTVKGNDIVRVPVEAYDTEGNLVDKITLLDKLAKNENLNGSVSASGNIVGDAEFVELDGKFYLEFTTKSVPVNSMGVVSITISTATQKVATKTLQVQPDARPYSIVGLKDGVSNTILANNTEYDDLFEAEDFLVEDQYGDSMDEGYRITPTLNSDDANKGFTLGGNSFVETKDGNTFKIEANDYKVDGETVSPTTAKFSFELSGKDGAAVKDKYGKDLETNPYVEIKFNATEVDEFASYEVAPFGTIYGGTDGETTPLAHQKDLKVYGVTDSGKKVQLPASAFKVKDLKNIKANQTNNKYELTADAKGKIDNDVNTAEPDTADASLVVVINHTGEELDVAGKVSVVAPKVQKIAFLKGKTPVSYIDNANGTVDINNILSTTPGHEMKTTDQYGVVTVANINSVDSLTFKNLESKTAKINKNGTKDATVVDFLRGDTVEVEVSKDGVKETITVKGKSSSAGLETPTTNDEIERGLAAGIRDFDLTGFSSGDTVTIDTNVTGTITLTNADVAKLVVNAPKASVVYSGTVIDVDVNDVDDNSFTLAEGSEVTDTLTVNDANGARIEVNGTVNNLVVAKEAKAVKLEAKEKATITNLTVNSPEVTATVDAGASVAKATTETELNLEDINDKIAEAEALAAAKAAKVKEIDETKLIATEGKSETSIEAAEAKLAALKVAAKDAVNAFATKEDVKEYEFDISGAENLLLATAPESDLSELDVENKTIDKENLLFFVDGITEPTWNSETGQWDHETKTREKAVNLNEVVTFFSEKGATFNTDVLELAEGKLTLSGEVLSAEDYPKMKTTAEEPYRITVMQLDNEGNVKLNESNKRLKAGKIAMYQDGTVIFEVAE